MVFPAWVSYIVGAVVILFGAYRIKMGLRSSEEQEKAMKRGGLYALPRRTHVLIGIVYAALGVYLILLGLGWLRSPFQ
ncbi:MAG TPA: hypothetical protein VML75_24410 [Kofleriaceae bacterium]|nr:hypothetical protein [Kofleriaceae bacterium]